MIRVLICDDHLIVRQGIKQILADTGDIVVVEEADNGPDAIRKTREASAALASEAQDTLDAVALFERVRAKRPRAG